MTTRAARLAAVVGLASVGVLGPVVPAHAEVTVDAAVPQGDGSTALVLALRDGCGSSATTGLSVEVPSGSALVGATAPEGWSVRLDGPLLEADGPGVPPGDVAEVILTTRLGAAPGDTVDLAVRQRCADGSAPEPATTGFEASAEVVDPSLAVREPADVPPGAGRREIAVAVGVVTALAAGAGAWLARRARRR